MTGTDDTFKGKRIRSGFNTEHDELLFSAVDIISALAETSRPRSYWIDLKHKFEKEKNELFEKIEQLNLTASDGKRRKTDVLNENTATAIAKRTKSS
ncbi:MAG: hypothetical protein LBV13_05420 [Methanomassiliicoccaceae archaeon]|jgi:hypothetical protein|nr:hypothetical protein [Methanomassiliicoccaceae archaeon]